MAINFPTHFFRMELLTDEDMEQFMDQEEVAAGVYVVPNHTGKNWFHRLVNISSAMTFMRSEDVVLFALGGTFAKALEDHKHLGFFVRTRQETAV